MQLRKTPTCESFDPITKTIIATKAKTNKSYVMEKTTTNIMQVGIMQ